MPITSVQSPVAVTSGFPSAAVAFASPPTVGNGVIVEVTTNPNYAGAPITGFLIADNYGNTYDVGFAFGQDNGCAIAAAEVETTGATFTVTATPLGTPTPDCGVTIKIREVTPLDWSNLVDLDIAVNDELSYATNFNVTTPATDQADEIVVVATAPRSFGSYNNVTTPSGFTDDFEILSGDGAGYAAHRILSSTGTLNINFSAAPNDGQPSMLIRSFRGATSTPPPNNWNLTGTGPRSVSVRGAGPLGAGSFGMFTGSTAGAGNTYDVSASDAATAADSSSAQQAFAASASDAATAADTATAQAVFQRSATDAATPGDSATATLTQAVSATDAATAGDSSTAAMTVPAEATDAVTPADSAASANAINVTASDAATAADSSTAQGAFGASASDAAAAADSATSQAVFQRAATDAAAPGDTATAQGVFLRSATDAIAPADSAIGAAVFLRAASDAVAPADSASAGGVAPASASDAVAPTDAASAIGAVASSASDAVAAADTSSAQAVFVRSATDSVTATDAVTALRIASAAAADAVAAADASTTQAVRQVAAADALTLADAATAARVVAVAAIEAGLSLLDAALSFLLGAVPQVDTSRLVARVRVLRERLRASARPVDGGARTPEIVARAGVATVDDAITARMRSNEIVARVRIHQPDE